VSRLAHNEGALAFMLTPPERGILDAEIFTKDRWSIDRRAIE
jgi:hypothetical protein